MIQEHSNGVSKIGTIQRRSVGATGKDDTQIREAFLIFNIFGDFFTIFGVFYNFGRFFAKKVEAFPTKSSRMVSPQLERYRAEAFPTNRSRTFFPILGRYRSTGTVSPKMERYREDQ